MENNKTYDEIGIFLPNSHFFKKSGTSCGEGGRRFFMADKESVVRQTSEYTDIMEKNHMEIPWHDYAKADSNVLMQRRI